MIASGDLLIHTNLDIGGSKMRHELCYVLAVGGARGDEDVASHTGNVSARRRDSGSALQSKPTIPLGQWTARVAAGARAACRRPARHRRGPAKLVDLHQLRR